MGSVRVVHQAAASLRLAGFGITGPELA
jgi:hypothetical protein